MTEMFSELPGLVGQVGALVRLRTTEMVELGIATEEEASALRVRDECVGRAYTAEAEAHNSVPYPDCKAHYPKELVALMDRREEIAPRVAELDKADQVIRELSRAGPFRSIADAVGLSTEAHGALRRLHDHPSYTELHRELRDLDNAIERKTGPVHTKAYKIRLQLNTDYRLQVDKVKRAAREKVLSTPLAQSALEAAEEAEKIIEGRREQQLSVLRKRIREVLTNG